MIWAWGSPLFPLFGKFKINFMFELLKCFISEIDVHWIQLKRNLKSTVSAIFNTKFVKPWLRSKLTMMIFTILSYLRQLIKTVILMFYEQWGNSQQTLWPPMQICFLGVLKILCLFCSEHQNLLKFAGLMYMSCMSFL